ncbi:amidase/aspartyl-tRNA(Asn)/glutamyl-tRNA(Gln) amidotransferase subunit A [Tepidamorphus gemmatus]|uniref:Indoleacetamide hydrolase n=1 Tax=Tepidamorphus gemmatus TaxID=747076 RepID=A0A4R3LRC7_9HYPH|nr:amidase [Tepidamorphus gemmatus]TCT03134.1 amidase/aspartyl-tRNA(Asn)/glutamyl-tRNA(Gln) amidotransferase subunit A [Tepidamorphus gemmatus]
MSKGDLAWLSGHEALAAFGSGALSPVELMEAVLEAARAAESRVNAVTEWLDERAMAGARAAEARWRAGTARPLEGLPLAVKEEMRLAGTRRSSASLVYRDQVDEETDVYVQRLIDAGAIPHLKTTTPEFCLLGATHSRLHGVTRNPWNPEFSPGGSSGGSGAVLATGGAPLATGTDIGGSIRIPASCCGVVGYKPPYGRNPEIPVFNLDYYSHSGPMARSVADCALMQNVTSGQDPSDIASLRERVVLDTAPPPDLRGWRIAYSYDLDVYEVETAMREGLDRALAVFRDLGAETREVSLGWPREAPRAAEAHLAHLWGAGIARLLPEHRDELCDYTLAFIQASRATTAEDYLRADEIAVKMFRELARVFETADILLCPTLAIAAPPAEYGAPNDWVIFDGERRRMGEWGWEMTLMFNMLSRCPVLSVPSGFTPWGVPTGVQIVAPPYHDETAFAAGLAYEAAAGPWFADAKGRPPAWAGGA